MNAEMKDFTIALMMKRRNLERQILELCREFEQGAPFSITGIKLTPSQEIGSDPRIVDVEVVAELRRHT